MYRIWIVEDDAKISGIMAEHLRKYGYEVAVAEHFHEVKTQFVQVQPHLVLLDINLPSYDGFYWCRQIRTVSTAPVIFVTAREGEMDQVMAIENGGDDYIVKPFHLDVLTAKVKSALRRAYGEYAQASDAELELRAVGGLLLDRSRLTVEWKGAKVSLSKNEFLLLECLTRKQGQVVSREELLEALWDDVDFVDDNTLTVNVTRVRRRLEELGLTQVVQTVRGQGYRLALQEGASE
ncbi:response regulator transcription factor [Paenibacillus turpanensis]|uniref:response regulator transcription factor n=1 Tax=Paenibacillus turpanensis TaxID=2689078 RepID=UPI00140A200E|nr:response regulator transcription factor [Paenibacillus turpanensis]